MNTLYYTTHIYTPSCPLTPRTSYACFSPHVHAPFHDLTTPNPFSPHECTFQIPPSTSTAILTIPDQNPPSGSSSAPAPLLSNTRAEYALRNSGTSVPRAVVRRRRSKPRLPIHDIKNLNECDPEMTRDVTNKGRRFFMARREGNLMALAKQPREGWES